MFTHFLGERSRHSDIQSVLTNFPVPENESRAFEHNKKEGVRKMIATLYGVGVGPGDPELMTLKACRLIRENEVIAVPGRDPLQSAAYRTAVQAVPSLSGKTLVPVDMPMVRDKEELRRYHEAGARQLEKRLDKNQNVIFLTLGDPGIYSTFNYLREIVASDGYPTELVSGIPSFCAAAARLNTALVEGSEPLHILPVSRRGDLRLDQQGNYVLMKAGKHMADVRQAIQKSGRHAAAVENCGMANEKIYRSLDEIPDESGYFSLVIVR